MYFYAVIKYLNFMKEKESIKNALTNDLMFLPWTWHNII